MNNIHFKTYSINGLEIKNILHVLPLKVHW